jgi:hypothetical protein
MPVTAAELTKIGKHSIDVYMKNKPIDAVNAERPFLQKLMKKRKDAPGGKQYMYCQVRKANDSNFQSFYGSETVTYNRKDTIEQAFYEYDSFHDGFTLHEDDFIRNGVSISDGPSAKATQSERETITNMFEEHNETLREGFEESLDYVLHAGFDDDITAVVPQLAATGSGVYGLEDMLPANATLRAANTYGGIAMTNAYWQNHANDTAMVATAGDANNILTRMRQAWRDCTKYGGRPDFIMCGSTFFDAYVDYMMETFGQVNYSPIAKKGIEGGEGEVYYMGVPIIWDPTIDAMDDNNLGDDATVAWKKRVYFINCKYMQLRPIKGQHMVPRQPPRVYNKYEYYWGVTTRFYLANTKPNAHAVLHVA